MNFVILSIVRKIRTKWMPKIIRFNFFGSDWQRNSKIRLTLSGDSPKFSKLLLQKCCLFTQNKVFP